MPNSLPARSISRTFVAVTLRLLTLNMDWEILACACIGGEPESAVAAPVASGVRYGWPVRTAMIAIALAYFFAGFQKWRYSGLPWVTSDNLRWILLGQAHPDGLALFVADRPWLAHVLAAGALLLETSFALVPCTHQYVSAPPGFGRRQIVPS